MLPPTLLIALNFILSCQALNVHIHRPEAITVPLVRRSSSRGSTEEFVARQRSGVLLKYGVKYGVGKRQVAGVMALSNLFGDVEYTGVVSVGTPPTDFHVIVDTGSADLWLSTAPCTGCQATTPLYKPSNSSTSKSTTTPFSITYGSGDASGTLAADTVSIGGFAVAQQTFAAVTSSQDIVSSNVAGLLGAGWQALSTSGAVPLLQGLAKGGTWPEQIFAAQATIEPGGILTLGGTNSSLFTGTMNFVPLTNSGSYWLIPLQDVSVGGTSVGVSATSVAIDTGTSLIGGPSSAIGAIYAKIPNSQPVSISGQNGYWAYPCATQVNVALKFGGVSYNIDPLDFNAGTASSSSNLCLGAFFEVNTGSTSSSAPSWIVGATFIKNVYTAFRFSPSPSVGFATLSSTTQSMSGSKGSSTSSAGSTTDTTSGASGGAPSRIAGVVGILSLLSMFMSV